MFVHIYKHIQVCVHFHHGLMSPRQENLNIRCPGHTQLGSGIPNSEDRASPVIGVQKYLLNDTLMKEVYSTSD